MENRVFYDIFFPQTEKYDWTFYVSNLMKAQTDEQEWPIAFEIKTCYYFLFIFVWLNILVTTLQKQLDKFNYFNDVINY